MTDQVLPKIGKWYKNESGDQFEVVALDEEEDTIEIQHFDGAIEEFDMDSWCELTIIKIEPPEDWSGSYDIEKEDYGVDLETAGNKNNKNPLEDI